MNSQTEYVGQLSLGQTILRLAVGSGMILMAMLYEGGFSSVVLLPLLAVYPITTGLIRVDPIYLIWQLRTGRSSNQEFGPVARTLLVTSAATMIGFVLAAPQGPLGLTGLLALAAVYPALAAIIGRDPFNAFSKPESKVVWLKNTKPKKQKHLKAA